MKLAISRTKLFVLSSAVVVLAGLTGVAFASSPDSTAAASAGPAGSTSAATSSAAAPPAPKQLVAADIPAEASEAPKGKEWESARLIAPNRGNFIGGCKMRALREWIRVSCESYHGAGLVAGDPAGVKVWAEGELWGFDAKTNTSTTSHVTVDLPVRRGESRIVTFVDFSEGDGYGPAMAGEAETLIVTWRAGEAEPYIAVAPD
ncbi:MAG: hypothetical protein HOW73_15640 [Polyangiaceae bacterium]|nr:hypothetical protein [Polyangiaceae bacterium]